MNKSIRKKFDCFTGSEVEDLKVFLMEKYLIEAQTILKVMNKLVNPLIILLSLPHPLPVNKLN
jgi:uncharacterized membrane protein YvlD (DUF360 family)